MKNRFLFVPVMLVSLASALMLGGCSGTSAEDLIRDDIVEYLSDFDSSGAAFVEALEEQSGDELDQLGISADYFADAYLDGFGYEVGDITVDGDSATVEVTITLKSYSDIMSAFESDFTEWIYGLEASDIVDMSESEMYEYAGQMLLDVMTETEPTEQTFDVSYTKNSDGDWEMDSGLESEMMYTFFS